MKRLEIGSNLYDMAAHFRGNALYTALYEPDAFFESYALKQFIVKYHFGKFALYSTFHTYHNKFGRYKHYVVSGSLGLQRNNYFHPVNFFYGFNLAYNTGYFFYEGITEEIMLHKDYGLNTFVGFNLFLTRHVSLSSEVDLAAELIRRYNGDQIYNVHHFAFIPMAYFSVNFHLFSNHKTMKK